MKTQRYVVLRAQRMGGKVQNSPFTRFPPRLTEYTISLDQDSQMRPTFEVLPVPGLINFASKGPLQRLQRGEISGKVRKSVLLRCFLLN